jgi:predicted branched-subunit amino acid permease
MLSLANTELVKRIHRDGRGRGETYRQRKVASTPAGLSTRIVPRAFDSPVRAGLSDLAPLLVGLAPFGLTIGAAVVDSGMNRIAGWLGGPALVAGAAHLSIVTALAAGTAPVLAAATAIVINLRFAAYGAAMRHLFIDQPGWFRWSAPYLIFDQVFALAGRRPEAAADQRWFRGYWVALTLPIYVAWFLFISAGMTIGPAIPETWQLWFVVPLMFTAILSPTVRDSRSLRTVVTAVVIAASGTRLPGGVGLLLAIIAGTAAGSFGSRRPDD